MITRWFVSARGRWGKSGIPALGLKLVIQAQHNVGLLRPDLDAVIEAVIEVKEIVHQAVGTHRLDTQIVRFEPGAEVIRKAVAKASRSD